MSHKKNFLRELLEEDQEPFHLKRYIAERRAQFTKLPSQTTKNLHLKKSSTTSTNLCKSACFLAWQNSPDVTNSPFIGFPSPAKNTAKSVNDAVRNQNQLNLKSQIKNVRFGVFESILKRLRDRSKNKKQRAIQFEDNIIGNSCSCNNHSSAHWSESNEEKSIDLETSISSRSEELEEIRNSDFGSPEMQFCLSPFRFSPCKSPSSSGRNTPEFCSPAGSPCRLKEQENENYDSKKVNVEEDKEEKEQSSPVSVLDATFEDGHESEGAEEDDDDLECSYANVQRAKEQLLQRLRRFEKLAELDPIELEKKLLEGSDDEYDQAEMDEPFSTNEYVEEKSKIISKGRMFNEFDFLKEVDFDTVDMIIESDFKRDFDGWKKFSDQIEEISAEIEFAIFTELLQQLLDELFDMDGTF